MSKRSLGRAIRVLGIESPRSPSLDNIKHILTRGQTRLEVSIKVKLEPTALLGIGALTLRLAAPRSSWSECSREYSIGRYSSWTRTEARYYCEGCFTTIL